MDTQTEGKMSDLTPEQQEQLRELEEKMKPEINRQILSVAQKLHGISHNPEGYSIKIDQTGRRMKLYIKLTKEESAKWSAFKDAVAPDLTDNNFAKTVMFMGVEAINQQVAERIAQMTEEEKTEALDAIKGDTQSYQGFQDADTPKD